MAKDMVFLHILIQDMVRIFRRLDHAELGLLMRITLENCLIQGPLKRDDDRLARLLGSKSKKTFNRLLDALISKGFVREEEGTVMALIAEKGIEHFQTHSANGKRAVGHRKDRQPGASATDKASQEAKLPDGCMSDTPTALTPYRQAAHEVGDVAMSTPFDSLVQELQVHASHKGHPNLADALLLEDAQRQVSMWFELDLAPEKIISKANEVMNKKGQARISSWKYFDTPIRAMARAP